MTDMVEKEMDEMEKVAERLRETAENIESDGHEVGALWAMRDATLIELEEVVSWDGNVPDRLPDFLTEYARDHLDSDVPEGELAGPLWWDGFWFGAATVYDRMKENGVWMGKI